MYAPKHGSGFRIFQAPHRPMKPDPIPSPAPRYGGFYFVPKGFGAVRNDHGDKVAKITLALAEALSTAHAARECGASPQTVRKVYRFLLTRGDDTKEFACGCGRALIHKGSCATRVARSPALQTMLTKARQARRCWTEPARMRPCHDCGHSQRLKNRSYCARCNYKRRKKHETARRWRMRHPDWISPSAHKPCADCKTGKRTGRRSSYCRKCLTNRAKVSREKIARLRDQVMNAAN